MPPGMDELFSLLWIKRHHEEGEFDCVIVDCAPTGETLRLLSFPDVVTWWLERILPSQRRLAPFARTLFDMPLPGEAVFDDVERLARNLVAMNGILRDRSRTTIRLVTSPDRMVVKESMRTFTYLNLYGYLTDAVVVNRLLPRRRLLRRLARGAGGAARAGALGLRAGAGAHRGLLRARGGGRRDARPAGRARCSASSDPAAILHDQLSQELVTDNGSATLRVAVPVRRARRPEPEEDRARGDRAGGRPEAHDHAAAGAVRVRHGGRALRGRRAGDRVREGRRWRPTDAAAPERASRARRTPPRSS